MEYWARFKESNLGEIYHQDLYTHCREVGQLAHQFAQETGFSPEWFPVATNLLGLIHDIGKYHPKFQRFIQAASKGIHQNKFPHAIYSSFIAGKIAMQYAYSAWGHHTGLPDDNYEHHIARLQDHVAQYKVIQETVKDSKHWFDIQRYLLELHNYAVVVKHAAANHLFHRMLFSCLVDADRLNSARFSEGKNFGSPVAFDSEELWRKLESFISNLRLEKADSPIAKMRNAIFDHCVEAGKSGENIWELTVPTGSGKTLSSVAFALSKARHNPDHVRRIIVVIPYLSIIEQNAAIYRKIFGKDQVLEHHSGDIFDEDNYEEENLSMPGELRKRYDLFTENWSAPIVITTATRFFNSIFSHRPRDLRRAHNIARSVVIFDEVQSIPMRLYDPILSLVREMAEQWHTTFLLCTATQPAFETLNPASKKQEVQGRDHRWPEGTVKSVIPDHEVKGYFSQMQRIEEPTWPFIINTVSWQQLGETLKQHKQLLCVVNTKSHATELYNIVRSNVEKGGGDVSSVLHLSGRMCPMHRSDTIQIVSQRIRDGLPVILISTQVVEAGVDLDFPVVYRAMAPLAAIVQTAGRCNREGKLHRGEFHIFQPEDDSSPYGADLDITRQLAYERKASVCDPMAMKQFFDQLYLRSNTDGGKDNLHILNDLNSLQFKKVSDYFQYIDKHSFSIIVPYKTNTSALRDFLNDDKHNLQIKLRKLKSLTVSVTSNEMKKIGKLLQGTTTNEPIIVDAEQYNENTGLNI
jgi:CRISPR-associated endonuclease/helicase Cas3